jgi:peptidoglycan/LPS O-acetylase OafA/YrhL
MLVTLGLLQHWVVAPEPVVALACLLGVATPVSVGLAWLLNRFLERPLNRWGRGVAARVG